MLESWITTDSGPAVPRTWKSLITVMRNARSRLLGMLIWMEHVQSETEKTTSAVPSAVVVSYCVLDLSIMYNVFIVLHNKLTFKSSSTSIIIKFVLHFRTPYNAPLLHSICHSPTYSIFIDRTLQLI